jgi:uncharacterized protein with PIN domain
LKITVLYIIIAGITALVLALFQYTYKSKKSPLNKVFVVLRFLSVFGILLLIINPEIEQHTVFEVKPNLAVVVDNSASIKHLNQDQNALNVVAKLQEDTRLNARFEMEMFTIGNSLTTNDSINFEATQTNISDGFKTLSQIYKDKVAPIVLISDGNQTYGADYEYTSKKQTQVTYPIILGDTVAYSDLRIQQLNVNKYAYLKNKFPVEIILVYDGKDNVSSNLVITRGNQTVFNQSLEFSETNNSKTINLTLPANSVGVSTYKATIRPLENEKNSINNEKPFAVEVIDEKTNIAIVSTMSHPDIGALKKAIESNEQRTVSIVSPSEFSNSLDTYHLAILYQPNAAFQTVIQQLKTSKLNSFIITGTQTQWSFLNSNLDNFKQEITQQSEAVQAHLNINYNAFIIEALDVESYPPLTTEFGAFEATINTQPVLYQTIGNTQTERPLLVTFEDNAKRGAFLLGEGIWKWRAQSYLNHESFQNFDNFIGKLVQYLAATQRRSRLNLNYESFYNGNSNVVMTAQYFNKNYEFDTSASLEINLKEKTTVQNYRVPFVLKQNNYKVDLGSLPAGNYDFTVSANDGELQQSGSLSILEYHIEQQFLNANVTKLQNVATNTGGTSFFVNDYDALSDQLLNDSRFAIIQKSRKNIVPLIDFKYLLALIVLALALEWFLRKYNGLI